MSSERGSGDAMPAIEADDMYGRRIVLAVTGGIAAYKACEVLRRLQDCGADVRVAMTRSATKFVSPLTFAALSSHRVIADTFEDDAPERLAHVRWGESCDLFCVVPATADFIAKMALGIAADFPSTLHLTVEAPVLVAPAMEDQMWAHPAVQENICKLRARGVAVVEPEAGYLASGRTGPGRLAEPEVIVEAAASLLAPDVIGKPLGGQRVLVTAGPTREHIDPVRMLTNPSSGKMGYAVAASARRLGAEVTLVSGPTSLPDLPGVHVVRVVSAAEMATAVMKRAEESDVVVMAAAVADFRPVDESSEKLRKAGREALTVELVPTVDILSKVADLPGERLVVGFAAETSDVEERGREKMFRKGCDMIVANRVGVPDSGFEADDNEVVVLDRLGGKAAFGPLSKAQVADSIWEAIVDFRARSAMDARLSPTT